MKRLADYIAVHRKWIVGAVLTAAASVSGYAWPQDPWIVTIIGTVAVGLGVNLVANRPVTSVRAPTSSGPPASSAAD